MTRGAYMLAASIIAFALGAATVEPACAEEAGEAPAEGAAARSPSGVRIFVDPETGELVSEPTEEQLLRLRVEKRRDPSREWRSSWDLREFSLPGGGRGVFLDGWADHELVVRPGAAGGLETVCSQRHRPEIHESLAQGRDPAAAGPRRSRIAAGSEDR